MLDNLKKEVFDANIKLWKAQLAILTWGNVSGISEDRKYMAIKPSGVSYESMKVSDIVIVDMKGKVIEGSLRPSSDTPTHLELYKNFNEIMGIVHTHSPYAVAWAQAGKSIPSFGTTHADNFFGEIPCTPSLTKEQIEGEYELNTGKVIVQEFKKHDYESSPAVLVKNHGPFAWSTKNANKAVEIGIILEEVAKMALFTNIISNGTAVEAPKFLQKKHYERKHGKKAYYGQKD